MITSLTPSHWKDYELIDSGNFEKLERFGSWILARPEPQALWDKHLPEEEWERLAHGWFRRTAKTNGAADSEMERGSWSLRKGVPEQWYVQYRSDRLSLRFRMGLTAFKHVGLFPEQAGNWEYIAEQVAALPTTEVPKVLNLFAYTGGASMAARAAGADVTHVDSVRQVISWGRENMEASGLQDIRWVVEDAVKFVQREVRRKKVYQGIILDPPAYGRGPEGEKWILEEHLNRLLKDCKLLLDRNQGFLVLNLYSMGFSALVGMNLLQTLFPESEIAGGEFYMPDRAGRRLPLGIYVRFCHK
ncbi:MAG: class I SAM-dependent methyltransferase [Bacteroidales bacterium]